MNVYQRHGFQSRTDYLHDLALEYDVDERTVLLLADMLGPSEDFDGLVSALEDYAE